MLKLIFIIYMIFLTLSGNNKYELDPMLSEFITTDTELNAIATAATIGLRLPVAAFSHCSFRYLDCFRNSSKIFR